MLTQEGRSSHWIMLRLLVGLEVSRAVKRVNWEHDGSGKEGRQVNRVTIFAGKNGRYDFHAMDQLTFKHKGSSFSINAKDVDRGMELQLDGKFQRVVRITA